MRLSELASGQTQGPFSHLPASQESAAMESGRKDWPQWSTKEVSVAAG